MIPLFAQRYLMPTPPMSTDGAVIAVSTTAGSFNLALLGPQTIQESTSGRDNPSVLGAPGHVVEIQADGTDVYYITGPNQAAVTGGNAPVAATNGTNAPGICLKLTNGSKDRRCLRLGQDQWIGFVGAAAGQLRIFKASL